MIRIAVTGGIACGKSMAASFMKDLGVAVCDADTVAHFLMKQGTEPYHQIVEGFGPHILAADGSIDRRILGDVVFNDKERLGQLNAILHPAVKTEIREWLERQEASGSKMAAVVIPLLYEADMANGWDAVICIACSPALQMERLRARGFDEEASLARLRAQMPIEDKVKKADFQIWNDGSPDALSELIRQALKGIEEKYT